MKVSSTAERSPTGLAPVLQLHPTRRCNLSCEHCYTSSGPAVREELDLGLLEACVVDAAELGYRQLSVSGGEPLLYRALADLLAVGRARGMVTTLTTNGTVSSLRVWETLVPLLDAVAVSIDGRPHEHDALRHSPGCFGRAVRNLANLRALGVPFGFIFTLTQFNVDSLGFVVELAAEQGAKSVQVHPLTVHGRAANSLLNARPDGIELTAAMAEATRLGGELGVQVHVDAVITDQLVAHPQSMVPARPVLTLASAAPVLVVEASARVLPLTHELAPRFALGSLREARLSVLAARWLASGAADSLAELCESTLGELTATPEALASYWYDEVAARSRREVPRLRAAQP